MIIVPGKMGKDEPKIHLHDRARQTCNPDFPPPDDSTRNLQTNTWPDPALDMVIVITTDK